MLLNLVITFLKELTEVPPLSIYKLKVSGAIFFILSIYTLWASSLRRHSYKSVTEQSNSMPLCV